MSEYLSDMEIIEENDIPEKEEIEIFLNEKEIFTLKEDLLTIKQEVINEMNKFELIKSNAEETITSLTNQIEAQSQNLQILQTNFNKYEDLLKYFERLFYQFENSEQDEFLSSALAEISQYATTIEKMIFGTINGYPVDETDMYYNNNAKYFYEQVKEGK